MCGLVYAQDRTGKSVNELVWDQYQKQKSRGQEGFGLFNGKHTVKAAMEKRIQRWMAREDHDTDIMLFHHRYPTSTVNVKKAAHPFHTGSYFGDTRYVLVHNGVISNPKKLKEAHEEQGITYNSVLQDGTFNDSEALLWDFALTMEGKQKDLKAYGGIAFICIKMVGGQLDRLYFGRNHGRPLNLNRTKDTVMLSSEGEGEAIKTQTLYTYNYKLNRLNSKTFNVPSWDPDYDWSDYNSKTYTSQTSLTSGQQTNRSWWNDYDDDEPVEIWSDALKKWVPNPYYGLDDDESFAPFVSTLDAADELITDMVQEIEVAPRDVTKMYFNLLHKAAGRFEDAYWYSQELFTEMHTKAMESVTDITEGHIYKMAVMLAAGDKIGDDPNWMEEEDTHPLWKDRVRTVESTLLIPRGA